MRLRIAKIKGRDFRMLLAVCLCTAAFIASSDSGKGCNLMILIFFGR